MTGTRDELADPPTGLQLTLDRRSFLLLVILLVQGGWFALILLRGWYSGPDLPNLAAATGQPLDWDYLSSSVGGHFSAPSRLLFWCLNRVAPLGWGLTVVLRLALQATATVLLWRLLDQLVGRQRWTPAVVGLYAVSPLLVPATAVLSNGIGLAISQVCLLEAAIAHVRYTRGGRLSAAFSVAALVLVALSFADQVAVAFLLLPVLSLGFLQLGSLRERLASTARRWPGWLAIAVVLVAFAALYLSGDYTGATSRFGLVDIWSITRTEWLDVLGPAFLGGPWRWIAKPSEWTDYASPPIAAVVLGQVAFVLLVVWSIWRTGLRALLAWTIPVATTIGSAVLVGLGRYDYLGTYIAPILRYSYYTAVTLAIGVVLAFARTPEEDEAGELHTRTAARSRMPARLLFFGFVAIAAASLLSGLRYAHHFWQNPSRGYVATLAASARTAGPGVELFDSVVPKGVVPAVSRQHFVSDVLALAHLPVSFAGSSPTPAIVSPRGHIVPAVFVPAADVTGRTTPSCGTFVQGAGSTTVQLSEVPSANDWFVQLQIYQPHANTVTMEVRDATGRVLPLVSGSPTFRPTTQLVAVNRRIAFGTPATLTLTRTDVATNFCLVHGFIGAPFPRSGS